MERPAWLLNQRANAEILIALTELITAVFFIGIIHEVDMRLRISDQLEGILNQLPVLGVFSLRSMFMNALLVHTVHARCHEVSFPQPESFSHQQGFRTSCAIRGQQPPSKLVGEDLSNCSFGHPRSARWELRTSSGVRGTTDADNVSLPESLQRRTGMMGNLRATCRMGLDYCIHALRY